jgi:hypothetical protein
VGEPHLGSPQCRLWASLWIWPPEKDRVGWVVGILISLSHRHSDFKKLGYFLVACIEHKTWAGGAA